MILTYSNFYDIASMLNEIEHNNFNPKEVAINAYDYLCEYELSIEANEPTSTMKGLCILLVKDMDYEDYADLDCDLDIETMNNVLTDFLYDII